MSSVAPPPIRAAALALLCSIVLAALAAPPACARPKSYPPPPRGPFEAKVSAVLDGDTLHAIGHAGVVVVRIAGIDAPEWGQPYGDEARERLAALLCAKSVEIDAYKVDPFGRWVGTVRVEGDDAALRLLSGGYAWHFVRYADEQSPTQRAAYRDAENEARTRRAGVWRESEPEAPWDYRSRKRRAGAAPPAQGAAVRARADC